MRGIRSNQVVSMPGPHTVRSCPALISTGTHSSSVRQKEKRNNIIHRIKNILDEILPREVGDI